MTHPKNQKELLLSGGQTEEMMQWKDIRKKEGRKTMFGWVFDSTPKPPLDIWPGYIYIYIYMHIPN